jgi:hypothetical protein
MTLKNTDPRCAGIYAIGIPEACPDRDTCLRYLHFRSLDRAAGIENYRGIPVVMAVEDCQIYWEAE